LLADAAAGALDPEDAERLRVVIAERPWVADLLEEQRAIASQLDPGPTTGLTDLERARLRRSVLDQVAGAEPVPTAPTPGRPMPWARWAFAAAAAVVVVVVASVGLLGGGLDGERFGEIGDEVATAPLESDDRSAGDDEAGATSDAAVPEADLAAGDEAADGAEESALAGPSCATPERSLDDLVGRTFVDPDDARSDAEATDPIAFAGEPETTDGTDRITWVWTDEAGSPTGILEVVAEGADWRIERAVACG
jgi:hypothetical protein